MTVLINPYESFGGGLISAIQSVGLTSGLLFSLDARAPDSYLSGQIWADQSGNGNSFYLGAGSSPDANDPTFNGTPGALTSNEYWSFDGSDFFSLIGTNPCQSFHKDGAKFTIFIIARSASFGRTFIGDGSSVGTGFTLGLGASRTIELDVFSGGSPARQATSTTTVSAATSWSMFAVSVDENGGATASKFWANKASDSFNAAYTSPSSGNASSTLGIGGRFAGTSANNLNAGQLLPCVAAWSTNLSTTSLDNLYDATKAGFGL